MLLCNGMAVTLGSLVQDVWIGLRTCLRQQPKYERDHRRAAYGPKIWKGVVPAEQDDVPPKGFGDEPGAKNGMGIHLVSTAY
jgi:hypothetical protein